VESFQKFHQDVEADRKRTVLTLVALIIKNIHQRTGRKLGKPKEPVKDIISRLYPSSSEIFSAAPGQMAQLKDDSSMKEMIKNFFPVKQFAEITDIATIFKDELSRYERRALNISSLEKG
jgi:hypothetical protein